MGDFNLLNWNLVTFFGLNFISSFIEGPHFRLFGFRGGRNLTCVGKPDEVSLSLAWLFPVAVVRLHIGDQHAVGWGEGP